MPATIKNQKSKIKNEPAWTSAERTAWSWPRHLTPSQWAQENRYLGSNLTSEPGPWRNERTPYLVGIMDAMYESGIEGVVVMKGGQVGYSEAVRNIVGYWIDREPGPCMVVMPDQKSTEALVEERFMPLLQDSPAVTRHLTERKWDVKKASIKTQSMTIYFGWAGSSQMMKSRPIRYLALEEPDEFPDVSGPAGNPISKAMKRITTYASKAQARVLLGGTPTTRRKPVWKFFERCGEKRHFWVPCPHCGKYQILIWGGQGDGAGVKWPKREEGEGTEQWAARVDEGRLAWYQCEDGCRIDEKDKLRMLQRGVWANEDQVVLRADENKPRRHGGSPPATPDAQQNKCPYRIVGLRRRSKWIAFHIPSQYSPWLSWSTMVGGQGEFLLSKSDPRELEDWINQRLAEPFEEIAVEQKEDVITAKVTNAGPAAIFPAWATAIFATVDTQKDWFKLHIGAWGYGYRYQLLMERACYTFDELKRVAFESAFPVEGQAGSFVRCPYLLIDSGGTKDKEAAESRTSEVYEFALSDLGRILPLKGSSHAMKRPWTVTTLPNGIRLHFYDADYYRDMLYRLINDPDPVKWMPHKEVSKQYVEELANRHKVVDRKSGQLMWLPVRKGARLEASDCEVYQCLAADMANMGVMGAVQAGTEAQRQGGTKQGGAPAGPADWVNGWKGNY